MVTYSKSASVQAHGFVADFEFVPHPNLRAIPIQDTDIITKYFLAYLKEREMSRLIVAFCDVAFN